MSGEIKGTLGLKVQLIGRGFSSRGGWVAHCKFLSVAGRDRVCRESGCVSGGVRWWGEGAG